MEKAHQELAGIFGALDRRRYVRQWLEDATGHERALTILQEHPDLALQSFDGATPLCHFLSSKTAANLEIIQAVCSTNPIAMMNARGTTPLHYACISEHVSQQVVEYIYQKNPSAIMTIDHRGRSPPVYLFLDQERQRPRSSIKLDTLKMLMNLHPSCVKASNSAMCFGSRSYSIDLLASALVAECPGHLYDAIVRYYPKEPLQDFMFGSSRIGGHCQMGVPEADALCQILPRLKVLKCQPQRWSRGALAMLLDQLANDNPRMETLVLTLARREFVDQPDTGDSLTGLIQRSASLKALTLTADVEFFEGGQEGDGDANDNAVLQSILLGLSGNNSIQELCLSDFVFPSTWAPQEMGDVILEPTSVQTLALNGPHSIANEMFLQGFLPMLPSLTKLSSNMWFSSAQEATPDLTPAILSLLQGHPSLQSLNVIGLKTAPVNARVIFEALRNNAILKSINIRGCLANRANQDHLEAVLQNDNLTLEMVGQKSFGVGKLSARSATIDYLLLLNQWGRRGARDFGTSKEAFVQILDEANSAPETKKLGILFGLLKERPELWAH
ncbi:expressed unknown protein [Seminavis robusta]|uniref:Uncharacterized protein n=1 Tax=Seminavis robusta TaxID=568900 RepID=A0A9N8HES7_9STRA|nr:expressed unknown protein [Seminavis robusta]|eukprot:Sro530_g161180.1 n/a (558) ;mRNA; f:24571-26244